MAKRERRKRIGKILSPEKMRKNEKEREKRERRERGKTCLLINKEVVEISGRTQKLWKSNMADLGKKKMIWMEKDDQKLCEISFDKRTGEVVIAGREGKRMEKLKDLRELEGELERRLKKERIDEEIERGREEEGAEREERRSEMMEGLERIEKEIGKAPILKKGRSFSIGFPIISAPKVSRGGRIESDGNQIWDDIEKDFKLIRREGGAESGIKGIKGIIWLEFAELRSETGDLEKTGELKKRRRDLIRVFSEDHLEGRRVKRSLEEGADIGWKELERRIDAMSGGLGKRETNLNRIEGGAEDGESWWRKNGVEWERRKNEGKFRFGSRKEDEEEEERERNGEKDSMEEEETELNEETEDDYDDDLWSDSEETEEGDGESEDGEGESKEGGRGEDKEETKGCKEGESNEEEGGESKEEGEEGMLDAECLPFCGKRVRFDLSATSVHEIILYDTAERLEEPETDDSECSGERKREGTEGASGTSETGGYESSYFYDDDGNEGDCESNCSYGDGGIEEINSGQRESKDDDEIDFGQGEGEPEEEGTGETEIDLEGLPNLETSSEDGIRETEDDSDSEETEEETDSEEDSKDEIDSEDLGLSRRRRRRKDQREGEDQDLDERSDFDDIRTGEIDPDELALLDS